MSMLENRSAPLFRFRSIQRPTWGNVLNGARRRVACVVFWAGYSCVLGAQTPPRVQNVNPDSLLVVQFEDKVKEYLELRKDAQTGISALKPTKSASSIDQHKHLLADKIRALRSQAKPGDLFSPQVSELFKRLISREYRGSKSAQVRASLHHADPVAGLHITVNSEYPERVPLQSTPPSILLNLPSLPPELDYRIVGRDLVLRDVEANIVLDYIRDAVPAS